MKLYFSPGACSLASHICLAESGLKYQTEQVDLRAKTTKSGANFRNINSKGYVPTLETQTGEILTEGSAILQYIGDHAIGKDLVPGAGTFERYRLQEWLNYIATEVHKGFSPLWNSKLGEDQRKTAVENLQKKCEWLDTHIQPGRFLMGSTFTVADAYLFTVLNWSPMVNFDLTKYPNLMGFVERAKARPAVQSAMKQEGLM